ncbi:alpha/beta fold hydrolase [Nocardia asteroides NBRC 15531]|uniref:Hydrolase n=1 Tax=Nocardia asteroides NBRC 15531 TaxID=1110697 RepID=U5EIL0_NOCAS|nr:alpha/beta hydrolase [Nocardia asteroides]TLF67215.1 alpha/beta fold hydrolase [Nocardia asteroides NBRC 15531]UGT52066.1 alpha/beta hydrolase [Nocardia asteroides]SFM25072.1 TAP-like protein [Nocardia asteroides]VEG35608.1 TAP-like protein [Nocardia asteroides]GAD86231.1 putative hydrolase [Nocardia asteroides NBRC 15531]
MRSGIKFAIYTFVLLLVGAACATSDTPAPPTTAAAEFVDGPCAATPHPVPALTGARCGELVVPVHRGETGGATMRLSVAVIPSQTQWNVFSHSYGTDLGLIYLRHDADAVESIVFDGVTPPSVAALGWTWASAEDAFDAMIAACAAQPACAARYPDLEATFLRLVGELEANPLTTTVDVPGVGPTTVVVDGGMLLNWFVPVATHLPADFPAAIDALAHGNPDLVASQWAAAWTNPDKVGFLAWGLTLSIWCREWVPFETVDDQLDQARAAFPEFPESVLAQAPQLPFLREGCQAWNVPKAPDSIRDITSSDVPALVLSGSYDGQTGPVWGDYIAKDLSRSTVVVVPGAAHGVYAEPCGGEIIAAFFDNPDRPDTACAETTRPPDYTISPPGP